MQTFMITGIEVFSVGTWNGDKYTLADLNEMVRAFTEIKEQGFFPYLKLGHNEEQALLKEDGLPCAGWVENLYVNGEKLMADFSYIPDKIYQLIDAGAYKTVSCEIYCGIEVNGVKYPFMLGAVALLGADVPGVMNLDTILAMYAQKQLTNLPKGFKSIKVAEKIKPEVFSQIKFEYIEHDQHNKTIQGEKMPPENQDKLITKLEADLETQKQNFSKSETELTKIKADKAAADKEIADLKAFKAQAEKEKADLEVLAQKATIEKYATELVSEKLCTPAMKPYIVALLGDEKKEYAFDKKTLTKGEVLKEALKLFAKASEVNFTETTIEGEDDDKNRPTEDAMIEEANKYSKENKVSFAEATKVVLKKYAKPKKES